MVKLLTLLNNSNFTQPDKFSGMVNLWIFYLGYSHHMIDRKDFLQNLNPIHPYTVSLPNGVKSIAIQEGMVPLNSILKLLSVFLIFELKCNLFSLSQFARDSRYFITLTDNFCVIQNRTSMRPIRVMSRGMGYSSTSRYR